MKHLDWKSFAIGILLTTTVVFGVAATNPTTEKQWDENQKWLIKTTDVHGLPDPDRVQRDRDESVGWEFVGITQTRTKGLLVYRKPVKSWPVLPNVRRELTDRLSREYDLNFIYP